MQRARKPGNEAERLQKLRSYQVLDTLPEEVFDGIVRLASTICQTPVALISLVDDERQWFKARFGTDISSTPREIAFCAHAILDTELLVVPNALADARFADNPLVINQPHLRFYAGAPLLSAEGFALGTLCVIDQKTRELGREQMQALRDLSAQVVHLLESRLVNERLSEAMAQLKDREEHFRLVTENTGDAILTIDQEQAILFASPAVEKIFGYRPQELVGKPLGMLIPAELRQRQGQAFARFLSSPQVRAQGIELLGLHQNGSQVPIEVSFGRFTQRGRSILTGTIRDISRRRRAEAEARESHERFRQLAETIEEVFWMTSPDKNELLYISPGYEKVWGRTRESVLKEPRSFLEGIHPEDRPRITQLILERKTSYDEVFRVVRPDGSICWVHDRAFPVLEAGQVVRVCGLASDITAQKEAELALKESQKQLVQTSKMSSLGEMAGGIAHEINNPVAIIHSWAESLKHAAQGGSVNPEKVIATAERIENTAQRISKIVRSLRSFARDAEKDPIETVGIERLIQETFEFCRERFHQHSIALTLAPLSEPLELKCRYVQISQVLLNLLNNAHDAVMESDEKWVRVEARQIGDEIELAVIDSGPGVPEAIRDKIMQPFFTTKAVGSGTGLGLSVSQGIVESHGGRLWLEVRNSAPTCFRIRLPQGRAELKKAG